MLKALLSLLHTLGQFWGYELCQECRNVELQKTLSMDNLMQIQRYGTLVSNVGNRFKKPPQNNCPLCQILFSSCLTLPGTHDVYANNAIVMRNGGNSRAPGILLAFLTFLVLLFGPAMVVGWLIFFLGDELVVKGGWCAFTRLNKFDRLTVLVIVSAVGYYDSEWGLAIGICLAFVTLVLQSPQIPPDLADYSGETGDELRAFPFVQWYEGADNKFLQYTCVSLCVVPKSFTCRVRDPVERMIQHFREHGYVICYNVFSPPRLYPRIRKQGFDSRLVLTWLDRCRTNHGPCGLQQRNQLPGLKVIDCETCTLVSASPDIQYVALSYVWGQSQNTQIERGNSGILESKLPPVIFDAIQVTKALNFRYLWVDQYCIAQDDPVAKHLQIKQMNIVYQNAEITIVAAAGNDRTYGLPGVGSRSRTGQRTVRTGRYRIVQTMDLHHKIRSSKWFTRAWTFQEGLLSRRRLIFTDDQVCFECNMMNCAETISCSQETLHNFQVSDKSESPSFMRGRIFGNDLQNVSPHQSVLQLRQLLEQYTSRKLSYDDDSLNAFLGVFQHFESQNCGMRHLWGVPFIAQDTVVGFPFVIHEDGLAGKIDSVLVDGLCWMHKHSCWEAEREIWPKRRPKFPSWSWAGWAGAIQHDRERHKYKQSSFVATLESTVQYDEEPQQSPFGSWLEEVVLELDNGARASFEEIFLDPTHDQRFSYPKAILFNARTIPPEAFNIHPVFEFGRFRRDQWVIDGIPAFLNISQGPSSDDLFGALQRQEFYGILLGLKDGIDLGMPSVRRCGG